MADARMDPAGIHAPDYFEILEDLKEAFRAIYGPDIYLEEDSQDGQLIAVFAQRYHDLCTLAVSVYNAYSPATAQGAGLSSVVKTNGIRRKEAARGHADITLTGQAGTLIRNGVVADGRGNNWMLPDRVILPVSGEITVTALAENAGDIRAAAGEIIVIAGGGTRGWQRANNVFPAVPGTAAETDSQLRQRQAVSTSLPSLTVFEGTLGAIADVPGVTRFMGYENDTSETDVNGIPPHTICVVVEGGDAAAIASAIARKKTPGCGTFGNTATEVPDRYGVPNTVFFSRPKETALAIEILLRPMEGFYAVTLDDIRKNLLAHVGAEPIGSDVLLSKLYTPVNSAEPVPGKRTFDVLSLKVGPKGGTLAPANLDLPFDGAASLLAEDIALVIAE